MVPENELGEWTYEKFQKTPFSWLIAEIEKEAIRKGFTKYVFASALGEVRGTIGSLKKDATLEVRWDFIQTLAAFSTKHLDGKYHLSFIAALSHPEIFDLATRIVNQKGRVIRELDIEEEALDFESRYRLRLKGKIS